MYRDDLFEIERSPSISLTEKEMQDFFDSKVWKSIQRLIIKRIAEAEGFLRSRIHEKEIYVFIMAQLDVLEWMLRDIEGNVIKDHIITEANKHGVLAQVKQQEITNGSEYFKKKLCSSTQDDTIDVVKLIETYVSKYGDFLNGPSSRSNSDS